MSGRLEGHTAIVSGAGSGIGRATAELFAEQGAHVVVADVNAETGEATASGLRERGLSAYAVQTDVAERDSFEAAAAFTREKFGPSTILVNNAGIAVFSDPLALTEDEWKRCFSVDLDGVWYGCRAVLADMLEQGRGSIVNVASVHSFQIIPHCFPYPVAKHGVIGLTRALAVEYGPVGIRVNAVCPGYIETQVTVDYWATFPDPEAEKARAASFHALKRVGRPEEVAAAILFLASDESSFVTGASLMIDGGGSLIFHE